MKLSKKFKAIASIALAVALVVPTIAVPSGANAAKKISFTKKKITVNVGKSKTVKVKNCKTKAKTKFSSSNSSIVSVKKKKGNTATIKGVKAGTATVKCTLKKKSATIKVTVKAASSAGTGTNTNTATGNKSDNKSDNKNSNKNDNKGDNKKPSPTARTYPSGYVYKQSYDVTRWYEEGTSSRGYKHKGYKDVFAIWMVGFFDNQYDSTTEELNDGWGPELDNYRGTPLTVTGDFSYEGTSQKTILLQLNYTKPSDYPIVWKWEAGADKAANNYAKELNMTGVNGSPALAPNTTAKLDATFTIPKDAVNGDKDDETGRPFGIYLYFPSKPGGKLAYRKDNTFHFKNFAIKESK